MFRLSFCRTFTTLLSFLFLFNLLIPSPFMWKKSWWVPKSELINSRIYFNFLRTLNNSVISPFIIQTNCLTILTECSVILRNLISSNVKIVGQIFSESGYKIFPEKIPQIISQILKAFNWKKWTQNCLGHFVFVLLFLPCFFIIILSVIFQKLS